MVQKTANSSRIRQMEPIHATFKLNFKATASKISQRSEMELVRKVAKEHDVV